MFHAVSANRITVAQFESEIIAAKTRDGLAAAKAMGRIGGRKPKLTQKQVEQFMAFCELGMTVKSIAEILGVTRQVVYRAIEKQTQETKP